MSARIIFAGADSPKVMDLMAWAKVRSILLSFYYIRKRKNVDWAAYLSQFEFVMIDSGAHTFKAGAGVTKHSKTKAGSELILSDDPVERDKIVYPYMDEYAEWIVKYQDYISTYVEMDIDELVGKEKCDEYREYMLSKGMPKDKMMPVFHTQKPAVDTLEDFEKWCKEYQYCCVSFGGVYMGFVPLFNIAKKYGTKVHGLAMTNHSWIHKLPFFSVDSTSWLTGVQFGATFVAQNGRLKAYNKDKKFVRKSYQQFCKRNGIDFAALLADKSEAVNQFNVLQWAEWDKALDRNKTRDYWLRPKGAVTMEDELDELSPEDFEEGAEGETVEDVPKVDSVLEEALAMPIVPNDFSTMPVMQQIIKCDNCYLTDRCPAYVEGAHCRLPVKLEINSGQDIVTVAKKMLEIHGERVLRQAFIEKIDGGQIDGVVTGQMKEFLNMAIRLKDLLDTREEVIIKAKGQGVISKIFGGGGLGGQ